jgi:hypothetical protein
VKVNINLVRNKLKTKLKSSESITKEDLKTAMTIAKQTGYTDDRVLFAKLKYAYEGN